MPQHESAWLYKIAHNVCLSRRLSATRRARVETPRDLGALQDEVGAPVRSHDELIGLDDVLAEMPERLRTAFLMREWQGLSYHEIADELGVSHSAVETLIFRARRHLAKALETGAERTRRARRALDLGWILAGIKGLLGGAGAAKAVAAAAAVAVALAGVAGGRALADTRSPAAASPSEQLFARALASAPVLDRIAPAVPASAQAAPTVAGESPLAAAPAAGRGVQPAPAEIPAVPAPGQVAAAAPAAGDEPAAPASPAAAAVAPAVSPPPLPQAPVSPPPASAVPVPAVEPPAVQAPAVQVPTVQVPTVQTPTVEAPAVEAPVQVPTVQTPTVQAPALPAAPSLP